MGSPVVMALMKLIVFGVLGLLVFLDVPSFCNGGSTSSFIRKDEKAVDMPLDSDVFRVPPGYNAPQQVFFLSFFLFFSFFFYVPLFICFIYIYIYFCWFQLFYIIYVE